MRPVDRILQRWRIRQGLCFLEGCDCIIDVGAYHGELFQRLGPRLVEGFGIEALLPAPIHEKNYRIVPGFFPAVRPDHDQWDAITMFAVLEHIPAAEYENLARACHELLREEGRMVITVPAPAVDKILSLLKSVRIIDGMSLEEHHGFLPERTPAIFGAPRFRLLAHRRFQLGLNHVFVFEKGPVAKDGEPNHPGKPSR